jgi:putative ABC transport system substrate-binding protein
MSGLSRLARRSALRLLTGTAGLVALSACTSGLDALTRTSTQPPQVAVWNPSIPMSSPSVAAFLDGLTTLGYTVGTNIYLDWRTKENSWGRPNDEVAQELVAMQPAAIVVVGTPTLVALAKRTRTIPLISCPPHRPLVSLGLANSTARPGGNVTGTELNDDYYAKMVELLKATIPSLTRLGFVRNPTTLATDVPMSIVQSATSQLGLEFVEFQARNFDEIDTAFAKAAAMHADGMVVATDAAFTSGNDPVSNLFPASDPLMALPLQYRIPVIYSQGDAYVASGGLMGFGTDLRDSYKRTATYVDKILHGAAPGDLPIEQSMVYDVSVNLGTARALGITFPAEVLAQANLVFR